jgi:hypothetical protein
MAELLLIYIVGVVIMFHVMLYRERGYREIGGHHFACCCVAIIWPMAAPMWAVGSVVSWYIKWFYNRIDGE